MAKAKSDGFHYDLNEAMLHGNVFEKIFHSSRLNFWLKILNYEGMKVLDVGCNTGIVMIPLLENGVDVTGVDISEGDIKKAKKNLLEKGFSGSLAKVGDAKKLPFKNNTFDAVFLSDVLEHVSGAAKVAKEAIRVTKKGGYILATVPNDKHPVVRYNFVRKMLSGRDNVDEYPDEPYNIKKLRKLFPSSQTKLLEHKFIGFWVEIYGKFQKL